MRFKDVLKRLGIFSLTFSLSFTSIGITSLAAYSGDDELGFVYEAVEETLFDELLSFDKTLAVEEADDIRIATMSNLRALIEVSDSIVTVTDSVELSQAIAQAGLEDVTMIEIANDIYLDEVIEINRSIILRASEGVEAVSLYSPENSRHFIIKGEEIYFTTENVIIDGENSGGGIQSTASHLILDITICNTNNAGYGAIQAKGNLTINGGEFFGNTAVRGGAIYVESGSNLSINGGKFYDNIATESGGAIHNNGGSSTLGAINGGEIYSNAADLGGGVYSSSILTINGGEIFGNTASAGGGVYNSNILTINGGEIFGNMAEVAGGGIFAHRQTRIEINSGKIYSNTAKIQGGGIGFNPGAYGEINGGEIYNNAAQYGGGANISDVEINGGQFYGNTAEIGGGIYFNQNTSYGEPIKINEVKIYDNTAEIGGGIYFSQNASNGEPIKINEVKIYDNTAEIGGGLYFSGETYYKVSVEINGSEIFDNTAETGGGIFVEDLSKLKISNSTIKDNHAAQAFQMTDEADIALHNQQIAADVTWTNGFDYIYNNLDVGYTKGTPIETNQHTVTITVQYPEGTIENQIFTYAVLDGDSFLQTFEVESGYRVAGVQIEKGVDMDFINKVVEIESVKKDMSVTIICR